MRVCVYIARSVCACLVSSDLCMCVRARVRVFIIFFVGGFVSRLLKFAHGHGLSHRLVLQLK